MRPRLAKQRSWALTVVRNPATATVALFLLFLPAVVQAQFTLTTNGNSITIIGYTGPGGAVVIPNTTNGYAVASIGGYAFAYCASLTRIVIPSSITNIGAGPFLGCASLTNISVNAGNPSFSSVNGVLFDKGQDTLIDYPEGLPPTNGIYTITNSVTTIEAEAFMYCTSLTNVVILGPANNLGGLAFAFCTNLTSADFEEGNAPPDVGNAFYGDPDAVVYYLPGTTGWGATFGGAPTVGETPPSDFEYETYDGSITIQQYIGPAGVVVIPGTINGYPVTSIEGEGLNGVFQNVKVTSVTIPGSVTSIGFNAFQGCTSLTNVTIANGITTIWNDMLNGCTSLTSVTIPNSVTNIGEGAFQDCIHLTSITIPGSVTSIEAFAFDSTGLTNIFIPNSVTSIGFRAFYYDLLTSVTIPSSVTNIGDYAFQNCESLISAYFQGNAPPDDGTAFSGDPATVYYLPGTTGWSTTFGGVPAVLWNPQATALTTSGRQFGFNITGPTNATIVVEACTNLANPVWIPISTNVLASGTSPYTDVSGTNNPSRFYRFAAP